MASLPFTSLHHPLRVDASLARLGQEPDFDAHVRQLVLQVLLTTPGERINRPDFGCGVRRMVFAPNGEVSATLAQASVYQALSTWLPEALAVAEVSARAVDNVLHLKVGYVVKVHGQKRYLNLQVVA